MKKLMIVLLLSIFATVAIAPEVYAKGGGGGRGGGGAKSSSSSRSSSTSSKTSTPSAPKTSTPSKPSVSSKPSSSTKTTTAPSKKTIGGKTYSNKGNVVDANYQPKFRGGYTPPVGSTVYYRQSSVMDWLPFYLIWSSSNAHREAVVQEPGKDGQPGKETIVKEEGTDGMYIWNWIISIIVLLGLGAVIVYLVHRYTRKNKHA